MRTFTTMKIISFFTPFFLIFALLFSLQAEDELKVLPKEKKEDKVVATVNGVPIYFSEFKELYENATRGRPYKKLTKEEFLDYLIKFELAVQKAQKLDLHKTALAQQSFRNTIHNLLVQKELTPQLQSIKISDQDMESFFKERGWRRFSQIVLIPQDKSEAEINKAKTKAENLQKEFLKNPQSFEELAKRHSQGPAAEVGGDIGYKSKDDLLPELVDAAFKIENVGSVSSVIKTFVGFHIFQLADKPSLEAIKQKKIPGFQERVESYKRAKMFENYYNDLKKQAQITLNKSLLNSLP